MLSLCSTAVNTRGAELPTSSGCPEAPYFALALALALPIVD